MWPTELSDTALVMSSEVRRNGQIKNQLTKEKGSEVNESFTNAPTSPMQAGGVRVPVLPKSRHAISHTNSHANPDPLPSHGKHKRKNKQRTCVLTAGVREHSAWAHEMTEMASRIPGPVTGHSDTRPTLEPPLYVLREGGDNSVPEGECGKGGKGTR